LAKLYVFINVTFSNQDNIRSTWQRLRAKVGESLLFYLDWLPYLDHISGNWSVFALGL